MYDAGAGDTSQLSFNQSKAGLNISVATTTTGNVVTNTLAGPSAGTYGANGVLTGTLTVADTSISTNVVTYVPHVNTTTISST